MMRATLTNGLVYSGYTSPVTKVTLANGFTSVKLTVLDYHAPPSPLVSWGPRWYHLASFSWAIYSSTQGRSQILPCWGWFKYHLSHIKTVYISNSTRYSWASGRCHSPSITPEDQTNNTQMVQKTKSNTEIAPENKHTTHKWPRKQNKSNTHKWHRKQASNTTTCKPSANKPQNLQTQPVIGNCHIRLTRLLVIVTSDSPSYW